MKHILFQMIIAWFIIVSVFAGTNTNVSLDTLANTDGDAYIATREALVAKPDLQTEKDLDPKLQLLSRLLQTRRNQPELFVSIQAIVEHARSGKPFEIKTPAGLHGSISLGTKLARQRSRNDEELLLAMAELLWKTSGNAYEKRCALHVLSLSEKPLNGLYEVLRDELKECKHSVLAKDILSLITQYVLTYGVGDRHQLLDDMMFAVRKFPETNSIHALAKRVIRGINSTDSTALLDEIERIEEQNSPVTLETRDATPLELEIK
jgi:hypothetical protein